MRNPYYDGPLTDHFDGRRFHVPGAPSTDKTFGDMLKWYRQRSGNRWPKPVPTQSRVRPDERSERLTVTHIGHASVLLQCSGYNLLVDPVWSERAGPFRWLGPRRHNAPGIAFEDLPQIDVVLLTHNHYDHLDMRTLQRIVKRHNPYVLVPLGNDTLLKKAIPGVRVTAGDWWSEHSILPELRAVVVPAYHRSSRSGRDYRMALWGGYILRAGETTVYCAGDTGHADGSLFKEIALRYPRVDLALLPIGAYEPRWFMQPQHMNPEEALEVACVLQARAALGIHWGTFHLTDEPREEPALRFTDGVRKLKWDEGHFLPIRPGDVWHAMV
jgi:L-ascorbate metabolism protein UlaG (beta-lactamase superfamily)